MADLMENREGREALRGAEEETVDVIAQVLTSDQWADLLKAPLERAARQGNRGLAQKLVDAGADIGYALHEAGRRGHEEIVSDLLKNGASVAGKNSCGYTPLHSAARVGKTGVVQLLLLKGADKDALNEDGYTPLYLATLFGRVAAAIALLVAGADVSLRFGVCKESVVHVAAQGGHGDIMKAATERGADVDAVDTEKDAPLHLAAMKNTPEVIDSLLEAGANIEARNIGGAAPLHVAADMSNLQALLALLKHGARVNAQNNDQDTPLHQAASMAGAQRAANVVNSLLRSGADETILNAKGNTAADVVAEVVDDYQLAEHVRELLANAPADRAWRRRGYLVMCHAHPDRMQQIQGISACAGVEQGTRSGAKLERTDPGSCTGTAGDGMVDGRTGGDWAGLVARVLGLQEEEIFRSIVGYL